LCSEIDAGVMVFRMKEKRRGRRKGKEE